MKTLSSSKAGEQTSIPTIMEQDDGFRSLRQFAKEEYDINLEECDSEMKYLLDNVLIIRPFNKRLSMQVNDEWSFHQLLHHCQVYLIKLGYNSNILVEGYATGNNESELFSSTSVDSVNNLRTYPWRRLHMILGCKTMADILLNTAAFRISENKNCMVQLLGGTLRKRYFQVSSRDKFTLTQCLYKPMSERRRMNPVPNTKLSFLQTVFKEEYKKLKHPSRTPKKLVPFSHLALITMKNHTTCRYFLIFDNICPQPQSIDNLERAVPKSNVMRFCSVIFEKVIPLAMLGSKSNKSHILHCLAKLINGERGFGIRLVDIISGLKIKEIPWLGKNYSGNINKQDFVKRQIILKQFIEWLFSYFFPRLLTSFFHITHISTSKDLLFYKHTTWRNVSQTFTDFYRDTYLQPLPQFESITQSESNMAMMCTTRVMPKKNNDFRVINIPLKGGDLSEMKEYQDHVTNEVRPARRILNRLRLAHTTFFPHLTSIDQLPRAIANYRDDLVSTYDGLPQLYFLKFDAKSCYDTLPKEKIMRIIQSLVDKHKTYSIYEVRKLEPDGSSTCSRYLSTLTDLKTSLADKQGTFIQGRTACTTLSGSEILKIVGIQVQNTITKIGISNFTRKDGVYQGLHLSSLFCDLVYEEFIERKLGFLKFTNSLILRIADDFLIISPCLDLICKVETIAKDGVEEYGLEINQLKTSTNFDSQKQIEKETSTTFCGFDISHATLGVVKRFDDLCSPHTASYSKTLTKLCHIFKSRSAYNTLSLKVNSKEVILEQLRILCENIAKSYCKSTRGFNPDLYVFAKFIDSIIEHCYEKVDAPSEFEINTKELVLGVFLKELQKKNSKHSQCISYIKLLQNGYV